jgi:predicted ATPase/transcriptional regulator with XRE-family HTH domain
VKKKNRMEDEVSFGLWLQKRRKALDLTRDEVARTIGCSISALRKIESDERRPSRQLAELIAAALEIPIEEQETFIKIARGELSLERMKSSAPLPTLDLFQPPQTFSPHLPAPPAPLIGREQEVAALRQMLGDPQCHLITLVGPGGIGKTRLAIEIASRESKEFAHGGVFVQLAGVTGPSLILPAIADALDLTFQGSTEPKSYLFNYLCEKQVLLVLDNLEHLLDGAGLFSDILQHAPRLKILCTSREPLHLRGEWLFEVGGLAVPENEDVSNLENYSATAFFQEITRRSAHGYQLMSGDYGAVARICRLVQGMPLAIELAAAWVRTLSIEEIAQEIKFNLDFLSLSARDMPARHRSLRAVFDHSWALTAEHERQVLARLSVFRGGFTRDAATQIAGARLGTLSSLVEKSLIQRAESGRFQIHELIRQYAGEHLHGGRDEERNTRDRHCKYYLALIENNRQLEYSDEKNAVTDLTVEFDNLRAAWEWALAQHITEQLEPQARVSLYLNWGTVLEFAGHWQEAEEQYRAALAWSKKNNNGSLIVECELAMGRLNRLRRDYDQGLDWLEQALATSSAIHDQSKMCKVLIEKGSLHSQHGNHAAAQQCLQESLALARAINDRNAMAWSLYHLSLSSIRQNNYESSQELNEQCLELFRKTGDKLGLAWSLNDKGLIAYKKHDYASTYSLFEESMHLRQEIGERYGIAMMLGNMGLVAYRLGDLEKMKARFAEGLVYYQELGIKSGMVRINNNLAMVARERGDYDTARFHYMESQRLLQGMDSNRSVEDRNNKSSYLFGLAFLEYLEGNLMQAKTGFEKMLDFNRETGNTSGYVAALINLGHISLVSKDYEKAFAQYKECLLLCREMDEKEVLASCLFGLAGLLAEKQKFQQAMQVLFAAEHLRLKTDFKWDAIDQPIYEAIKNALQKKMKKAEINEAWTKGGDLTLDQAVEIALEM